MRCSDCGAEEESVKEYSLNFGTKYKDHKVFDAVVVRQLCRNCLRDNVNLLKNELEFMYESDGVSTDSVKLDIYVDDNFLKNV